MAATATATTSDRVIGQISLFGVTKNRCGTLGIVVGREYWGDGLGTEAVRLMVGYGFLEMGLHRVQLGVYAYNDRAIRSYTRASGSAKRPAQAEISFHGGRWHDEVLMAILEDDWRHRAARRLSAAEKQEDGGRKGSERHRPPTFTSRPAVHASLW